MSALHRGSLRTRAGVGLVVLATLAACSSTNLRKSNNGALEGGGTGAVTSDATTSPTPGVSKAPGKVKGKPGATKSSAGTTGGGSTVTTPSGGTAPAPGTAGAPRTTPVKGYTGRVGPGITATTINIGITLFKIGGVAKGFGSDADPGDTEAQANAALSYVNAHGGIAGRKVVPIFHTFDLTRPGLSDGQSEQEACAKWTQDNKVFAVINITYSRLSLLTCLAKADVPGLHEALPLDAKTLQTYFKYWYSNSQVVLDRMIVNQVRNYCSRGFFATGAKVGMEYFDDPSMKRIVDETFIPELAKCGVPKKNVFLQAAPRGGQNATPYAAAFKRDGVTNVMFLGEGSLYPLFFMRAADQQGYRPKYGLSTAQTPALLLQDLVPAAQLKNAIGIGWLPTADVDAPQDPGPVNSRNSLCMDIERKAGQDMSNRQAAFQSSLYCGGLWWLQDNLAKASGLNSEGLFAAVNNLGTSFVAPTTWGVSFTSTKHDGPRIYRDFAWPSGPKSQYVSGNKPMV